MEWGLKMKLFKKKRAIFTVLLISLFLILMGCSSNTNEASGKEADYPKKPIKILVGFPAGGQADTATRIISQKLIEHLPNNANVVVESKPGGNGVVAMSEVVNAKADGYTLGYTPTGPITIHPHYGLTPYKETDPTPISTVNMDSFIVAVHPDAPWNTMEEFIEDLKKDPGKYSYGHPGAGSLPEITMSSFLGEVDTRMKAVPFDGNATARTALLGKDVDAVVLKEPDIVPSVQNGELKALMHFSGERIEGINEVPTAKELGYDIVVDSPSVLYGPRDLPEGIVAILDEAVEKTMSDPEVIEQFEKMSSRVRYENTEKTKELLETEFKMNKEMINQMK